MSIQEVSLKLSIPKHTLRFWEREFAGILNPPRSKGGQRRYTVESISIVKQIKSFREKGIRVREVKEKLSKRHNPSINSLDHVSIDFLATRVAEVVKEEVSRFFDKGCRKKRAKQW